jgi:hypothetical protein
MTDFALPDDPLSHQFGWPRPKREEEFRKLHQAERLPTFPLEFQGQIRDFPMIRVPINLPKYRLANGRTASSQEEWLARNASRPDFFEGDPELLEVQAVQHKLLLDLASDSGLLPYFKDESNKQINPILLDEAGFVVNGNRRLSTWRDLVKESASKYGHFGHINVVVLPHCDEREIDRIETDEQIAKDIKADYSWHTEANMMLAKRKRLGMGDRELAERHRCKESDVRELIDMRNYAAEYLRSRGHDLRWSLVTNDRFAFQKIVAGRAKISSAGEQELFKQAAFTLLDKKDEVGRRLYDAIPGVQEYIAEVRERLQERFQAEPQPTDSAMDGLFGGAPQAGQNEINMPLAALIQRPENAEAARQIIVEVIDSQRQLKKDSKAANFLVDCLARAQAQLAAAIKEGLRPDSNKAGAQKQIAEIRHQLARIEEWLGKNVKN